MGIPICSAQMLLWNVGPDTQQYAILNIFGFLAGRLVSKQIIHFHIVHALKINKKNKVKYVLSCHYISFLI